MTQGSYPVRIVMYAWGEDYVDEMLHYSLPALLGEGNLPALARALDCHIMLLTEERLFQRVKASPTYAALTTHCAVQLVSLDDLIAPVGVYGITLTCALYRAFEGLGEEALRTNFLFFNADWILAAHSFRSLIEQMCAGHRLIVAPSYCAVAEEAKPLIDRWRARNDITLSIPVRDLAGIAIGCRHNTVRGKTLNEKLFHMEVIEQFYWRVDAETILARQMPIAIVCMRPERLPQRPKTFWDYGTISELCPTIEPVVLSDSDDFLMLELRSHATHTQGLKVGWPSDKEIANQLASFITNDHLVYGRYTLTLHSADLPDNYPIERDKFEARADKILAMLPLKLNAHNNHPYWQCTWPYFEVLHKGYVSLPKDSTACPPEPLLLILQTLNIANNHLREIAADLFADDACRHARAAQRWADRRATMAIELSALGHAANVAGDIYKTKVESLRSRVANFGVSINDIEVKVALAERYCDGNYFAVPVPSPPGHSKRHRWLARHGAARPLSKLLSRMAKPGLRVLTVLGGHGNLPASTALALVSAQHHHIQAAAVRHAPQHLLVSQDSKFDICLFDLAEEDIWSFTSMVRTLTPFLAANAKVILFFKPDNYRWRGTWNWFRGESAFVIGIFPRVTAAEIYVVDGPIARMACWVHDAVRARSRRPLARYTVAMLATACSIPFWLMSNVLETDCDRVGKNLPAAFASITALFSLDEFEQSANGKRDHGT